MRRASSTPVHLGEAGRLERAHPRQVRRHHRSELILLERLVEPAGALERHRVVGARDLQIRVQLHGLAAFLDRFGQLASPHPDERPVVAGSVGSSGSTCDPAFERVERLVEVVRAWSRAARCARSAVPYVGRSLQRLRRTPPRRPRAGARTCAGRARDCSAARVCRPPASTARVVRLEKLAVDVARRAHAERGEHQVAGGQCLRRRESRWRIRAPRA